MTTFHVRHDLKPQLARELLLLLHHQEAKSSTELLQRARERQFEIGQRRSANKVLASLRDLGLIRKPSDVPQRGLICLTELGHQIANIAIRDRVLFAELIHLRYWWLFPPYTEPQRQHNGPGFAWAYQTICKTLWDESPTRVDRDRLVAMILSTAPSIFQVRAVSFSSSSVSGILHWLKALTPSCLIDNEFHRRTTCPPESLVLALEGAYRVIGSPLGMPLYLEPNVRELVCQATFLDYEGFEEVLYEAELAFNLTRLTTHRGEGLLLRDSFLPGLLP